MSTKIQWCDETINPIQDKIKGNSGRGYHCTKIGAGCLNCYAEATNKVRGNGLPFDNRKAEFEIVQSMLEKPLKWKKPRRIFVQSMGDLFHKDIPAWMQDDVFEVMLAAQQHTFILLTKRIERTYLWADSTYARSDDLLKNCPNLCLGVSISTQEDADTLIPILLQIPAAVLWVSGEPLLENIVLKDEWLEKLGWFVAGCESGPKRRKTKITHIQRLAQQCESAGVPCFIKQAEINGKIVSMPEILGRVWNQYPEGYVG